MLVTSEKCCMVKLVKKPARNTSLPASRTYASEQDCRSVFWWKVMLKSLSQPQVCFSNSPLSCLCGGCDDGEQGLQSCRRHRPCPFLSSSNGPQAFRATQGISSPVCWTSAQPSAALLQLPIISDKSSSPGTRNLRWTSAASR